MSKNPLCALVLLAACALAPAAENPAQVRAVVSAVKAGQPDFKALCRKGPKAIHQATTDVVLTLTASGQIMGQPQALSREASAKIIRDCRR
jgi:hypothetical protein